LEIIMGKNKRDVIPDGDGAGPGLECETVNPGDPSDNADNPPEQARLADDGCPLCDDNK
jgi:hypothetical protein